MCAGLDRLQQRIFLACRSAGLVAAAELPDNHPAEAVRPGILRFFAGQPGVVIRNKLSGGVARRAEAEIRRMGQGIPVIRPRLKKTDP